MAHGSAEASSLSSMSMCLERHGKDESALHMAGISHTIKQSKIYTRDNAGLYLQIRAALSMDPQKKKRCGIPGEYLPDLDIFGRRAIYL